MSLRLFGYWRSSATYRVRIALELKQLAYDYEPVNLLKGEQLSGEYLKRNPQGLVPTLATEEGETITQSQAIIEYLEERYPEHRVLPADAAERAKARAIASIIACEAQPFMNLRMQKYLKEELQLDEAQVLDWLNKWPGGAMASVEELIDGETFCVGERPTLADIFLIPQTFGAQRFGVDISAMPRIMRVYEHCNTLDAFIRAHPQNQPDAA
ncbi:MAG: maleylacetoacetate isomerase [Parvularculaceae bacterium]